VREFIFQNDPVKQFVNLITSNNKMFQFICIAHNAKAFDSKAFDFILKYLVENSEITEESWLNGMKIIVMTVGTLNL